MQNNTTALFDICDTLFDSNTTFDFLDCFVTSKQYKWIRHFSRYKIGKILNGCFWRVFRIDLVRFFSLRFINGYSKEELLSGANMFYDSYLINKKKETVFELLEELKRKNCNIVLASATADFMAETIARKINIETYYSTLLKYEDGICKGKIATDILGKKMHALKSAGFAPPYYAIVTDNTSDADLVENSDVAYIVLTAGNRKKWNRIIRKRQMCNVKLLDLI